MINYPKQLDPIFDKLKHHCLRIIIVGGYVRDSILGLDSKDIDIELYGIKSFELLEDILKEFGPVNSVGKSFGVCKLSFDAFDLDFSFPRIDNKTGKGYKGFDVEIDSSLDFKTASSRRDFTINAIGFDVIEKKILDSFNGINDLNSRVLKAVNNKTFVEDPLRVLRAVQFCARFELSMDDKLFSLCYRLVSEDKLSELPKERIFEEIKKLLLKSQRPSIGFKLLKSLGALKHFKNLYRLSDEKYTYTISNLDKTTKNLTKDPKTDLVLMLAVLCYEFNESEISEFVSNLSNEKELLVRVIPLVENLKTLKNEDKMNDYYLYKLSTKICLKEITILSLSVHGFGKNMIKRAKELGIYTKKAEPILHGKDIIELGVKPSNKFSKILDEAYEAQMHSEFNTYEGAIKWLKKYLSMC